MADFQECFRDAETCDTGFIPHAFLNESDSGSFHPVTLAAAFFDESDRA